MLDPRQFSSAGFVRQTKVRPEIGAERRQTTNAMPVGCSESGPKTQACKEQTEGQPGVKETRKGGRHGKGFIVSVSRSMRVAVNHRLTEADNPDKRERESCSAWVGR